MCTRFGATPNPPSSDLKLGIALGTLGQVPINGLRMPSDAGTCGWFIWSGEEFSEAEDFFEPLHVSHLEERLPEVLPYLALPEGWRFLLAESHEDVWFDSGLLEK